MDNYTVMHGSSDGGEDGLYHKGKLIAGWRELERHGYSTWYLRHCSQKRLAAIAAEVTR